MTSPMELQRIDSERKRKGLVLVAKESRHTFQVAFGPAVESFVEITLGALDSKYFGWCYLYVVNESLSAGAGASNG